jgi:hypothetical protein
LPFTETEKLSLQVKAENQILIYITTHLTEMHSALLAQCWPTLIAESPLFQQADCMLFITKQKDTKVNMTFINSVFAHKGITVHVRPNTDITKGLSWHSLKAFKIIGLTHMSG